MSAKAEGMAWVWLLGIPRLDWRKAGATPIDQQIIVRSAPGVLNATSGAPLVRVSVEHPAKRGRRFKGSGNSLAKAVGNVYQELLRAGVQRSDLPEPFAEMWF